MLFVSYTHSHTFSFALSKPASSLEAGARRQLVGGPVLEAGGGLGQRFSGQCSDASAHGFCLFPQNLTNLQPSTKPALEDLIYRLFQRLGKLSHRMFLLPLLVSLFPPAPLLLLLPALVFLLRHTGSLGTGTASVPGTPLTSFG